MKKGIISVIAVIAVIALIAWVLVNNKKENQAKIAVVESSTSGAVTVKIAPATKESLNLNFISNGNFVPLRDLQLLAETSGRVKSILVDEGSRVKKGQLLVRIDPEYANLDLQTAEAQYQKLKTDVQRYRSSFQTGGVTQAQLDEIELALRTAETQVKQARRRVSDANITSPISGIVNKRDIEIGAYVSPNTPLFNIVDVSKLKLEVSVNESQVVDLKLGDQIKITTSVFPDNEFSGKISFIAPKADEALKYPVEIEVSNSGDQALRAGMYATAHFDFPEQAPQVTIPRNAFVGGVSSNQIFVVGQDSTAHIREVVPGRIIGEKVEIIKGIEEGESVIVSGQINLVDGTKINPTK